MKLLPALILPILLISCEAKKQTNKADTTNQPIGKIVRPSLKDTEYVRGNAAIFLRPDSIRFENYLKEGDEIYEVDSDFGFGISAAMDSIEINPRFKNIKAVVSDKRFISLTGCKDCPVVIDRDTLDYCLLLSKPGKAVQLQPIGIFHAGAFLQRISDYFELE